LGIANLVVREKSILEERYAGEFDYILCVGVLHHLADPAAALAILSAALRPRGVLELMVYNRYHRSGCMAFQEAIRRLCGDSTTDFALALELARKTFAQYPPHDRLSAFVRVSESDALFADTFLQPVEHAFTVASLDILARGCGLELLQPRPADWDRAWNHGRSWNLHFEDETVRRRYLELSDIDRWQVANLILGEDSPLLWFYLQRADCGQPRRTERELGADFLGAVFERRTTQKTSFLRGAGGVYRLGRESRSHPAVPADEESQRVWAAVDGSAAMADVMRRLGMQSDHETINRLRLGLATSACPHLGFLRDGTAHQAQERDSQMPPRRPESATRKPLTLEREVRS
ncbi:MAG TPA: methyltransferase domain-containing protein, partial [Thermoanaerobaculia bacterium]|nr:methyltransferase domain-containing protein [Thermoanaerobaculia bacterium]